MKSVGNQRSVLFMLAAMPFVAVACGSKSSAPSATGVDETSVTVTMASSTDSVESSQPGCTGGPPILETELYSQSLVVRESIDGRWYCIEFGSDSPSFNGVPEATGSSQVQIDETAQSGAVTSYLFTLPAGFPETVSVRNENGDDLPVARGQAGDYLVVFDPSVGPITAEATFVDRTLDLLAADGSVITQVNFQGFGTGEFASYEQFAACVQGAGVDMPLPPAPGQTVPPRELEAPEIREVAWRTCENLLYSYLEGNGQGSSEFRENAQFVADCLADVGYFPAFNEQPSDLNAYQAAIELCDNSSPARAALVSCFNDNGLDIDANSASRAGPHDPVTSEQVWQQCRDLFVTWFVSSPMLVPDILPRFDCLAAEGWLIAVAGSEVFSNTSYQAARDKCSR